MKYLVVIALLGLSFMFSCKSSKKTKQEVKSENKTTQVAPTPLQGRPEKILEYKKGACHGRCPIYTMTFLSDGTVYYEGKQFSDKMGVHTLKISKTEIDAITADCRAQDFTTFPEQYKSMIPDFASKTVIYYGLAEPKSTMWREESNPFLEGLATTIEAIEKRTDWSMDNEKQVMPNHAISNQIIVELVPSGTPRDLITKFRSYGLKQVKEVAPNSNIYLFEYDESKIKPFEMLNKLSSHKAVSRAEFNKKISSRG